MTLMGEVLPLDRSLLMGDFSVCNWSKAGHFLVF
jgi:hypothetical protein